MGILNNIFQNITSDKISIIEKLRSLDEEVSLYETWLSSQILEIPEDSWVHTMYGRKCSDYLEKNLSLKRNEDIFNKAVKIIARLQKRVNLSWSDELGQDWYSVLLAVLILKVAISSSYIGIDIDRGKESYINSNCTKFQIVIENYNMDDSSLQPRIEESIDTIDELYSKYFKK